MADGEIPVDSSRLETYLSAELDANIVDVSMLHEALILSAVSQWHSSVPRGAESFHEVTADSITGRAGDDKRFRDIGG